MSDTGRRSLKGRDGFGRREFLQAGGVGLGALGLGGVRAFSATPGSTIAGERSAILLMLVGGPSQLETFDPKPDAPDDVRGPFGSIATRVPGVRVGEHLPGVAARMDRLALIRSLHHDRAPIHETGLQLMQTGLLSRTDEHPHIGAVASERFGRPGAPRPFVAVPGPIGDTGVQMPRGQTAGGLDARHGPAFLDPDADLDLGAEPRRLRESYGSTRFGRSCLAARKLVEAGARVVTVNMYETVFNRVSWDCHGSRPFSTMDDYRREVLPTFDRAFSALIDDLDARGMLATTLVAAVGEFGRTPRINESGGRDHWPAAECGGAASSVPATPAPPSPSTGPSPPANGSRRSAWPSESGRAWPTIRSRRDRSGNCSEELGGNNLTAFAASRCEQRWKRNRVKGPRSCPMPTGPAHSIRAAGTSVRSLPESIPELSGVIG